MTRFLFAVLRTVVGRVLMATKMKFVSVSRKEIEHLEYPFADYAAGRLGEFADQNGTASMEAKVTGEQGNCLHVQIR